MSSPSSGRSDTPPILQLETTLSDVADVPSPMSGNSRPTVSSEVVVLASPPPFPVSNSPIANATMDRVNGEKFSIDGVAHHLKDIKNDHLRKFCVDIKINIKVVGTV